MRRALLLVAIALASIATQGYVYGLINHGIQIPLVRLSAGDPAFAGDALVVELARTYTTVFYPALGALARVAPLPTLFFVAFVVLRVASVWAAYALARAVHGDERVAYVAAGLSSVYVVTFGLDFTSEPYLTHGALAQPMALAALTAYARGRVVVALAIAGALFAVHGMHAAHLAGVLGLAALVGVVRRDGAGFVVDRAALARLVAGVAVFLAAAAPTLWWMRSSGAMGGAVPAGYFDFVRAWAPVHFFPTQWAGWDWALLAAPLALWWPVARLAAPSVDEGRTARVVVASFAFAVAGGVVVEIVESAFLLRLHPLRAAYLFVLAGLPFFARAVVALVDRRRGPASSSGASRDDVLAGLTGVALVVAWCFPSALKPIPLLAVAPLVVRAALPASTRARGAVVAVCVVVGAALALVAARAMGTLAALGFTYGFDPGPPTRGTANASLVVLALVLLGAATRAPLVRRAATTLIVLVAVVVLAGNAAFFWIGPTRGRVRDWREVQQWAASSLAPGARVLVPLAQTGFRSFSNQTPALDWMEGDLVLHHPASFPAYEAKLRLYGWQPGRPRGWEFMRRLDALDERLGVDDARRIGAALGASVAVRRTQMPRWSLPVLYENASYVVHPL